MSQRQPFARIMRKIKRLVSNTQQFLIAWLCGWLATYLLACLSHSSQVIVAFSNIDINVPVTLAFRMMLSDMWGLLLGYGSLLLAITGIAYLLLIKLFPWQRSWFFVLGGGMAMAATLWAMQPLLGVTLIAGARSTLGFLLQCIAGGIGAWVFFRLSKAPLLSHQ